MIRSKNKTEQNWTNRGSFMCKPQQGWLHPDEQLLPTAGVCYGIRYVGSMAILESMKALDVETRTNITKECIHRVCCAVGLKTSAKTKKKNSKIQRYLAPEPNLSYACLDVNMTITTDNITLMGMDSGDLLYHHLMPTISFASGGDMDTMDFIAYVAKDDVGRTCHVLECGGGLAQDVITTIGQAFELRFKHLLAEKASPVTVVTDRIHVPQDDDYYNDRPDAEPPSSETKDSMEKISSTSSPYQSPTSNQSVNERSMYNGNKGGSGDRVPLITSDGFEVGTNYCTPHTMLAMGNRAALDPFDMKPFNNVLQNGTNSKSNLPTNEPWFHGKISRQKCEELLRSDGHFLVRESPNSPGQYVLSGRHAGHIRHLLLVDPEGKVRTKDQLFTSVSHLVNYHMLNNVPIVSVDSELMLKMPVTRSLDFD